MSDVENNQEKSNGGPAGQGWADARPQQSKAFFRVYKGATAQGVLKGRFPKPGNRKGFIYQLVTTVPCKATVLDEDASSPGNNVYRDDVDIPVGTLLSIDERSALENLKEFCEDPAHDYEIYIKANEKIKLANNNTFWDFTVMKRTFEAPF